MKQQVTVAVRKTVAVTVVESVLAANAVVVVQQMPNSPLPLLA